MTDGLDINAIKRYIEQSGLVGSGTGTVSITGNLIAFITSQAGGTVLTIAGTGASTTTANFGTDSVFFPVQAATASAPSYVKGGIYFDTTLNKLRVGGATDWETITSA